MREGYRFFTKEQKEAMLIHQNYSCAHCGTNFTGKSYIPLQAHHIIAFRNGGKTTIENGVMLCPNCHRIADNDS